MKIKLTNFDSEHYATNLTQKGDSLKWESVGATHFMIIRDKFGSDIRLTDEELNTRFNGLPVSGKETRLEGDRYFIILPRLGINTYIFPVKPASYAVFACELKMDNEPDLTVYNPNDACFYQCSVSATVEISIKKAPFQKKSFFEKLGGLFKPEEEERVYYNVSLPEMPGYAGELLCYSYDGCAYKYPITTRMMNKTVQIPEWKGKQPWVESLDSNAYKINMI
ncbi:MAG: hypothetical protein FWH07_03490 [Oscillospiraceae bacterium]|nr:hypothetical protein [Oscillospiraceae bacterium]